MFKWPSGTQSGCLTSEGKLFQSWGAAAANILSPKELCVRPTICVRVSAERSRLTSASVTSRQSPVRSTIHSCGGIVSNGQNVIPIVSEWRHSRKPEVNRLTTAYLRCHCCETDHDLENLAGMNIRRLLHCWLKFIPYGARIIRSSINYRRIHGLTDGYWHNDF